MKKKLLITVLVIISFLLVSCLGLYLFYNENLKPVNKNDQEKKEFVINIGTPTAKIIESLKKEDLIKNELVFKIYVKLHHGAPQAGTYKLSKSMSASDIYDMLVNGKATFDTVWVTFVEGKRLSYIRDQIVKNFDFTKEEVDSILNDKEYIKELIKKYDILTDEVLNDKIYYPLEGYLFPDTYEFLATSSIKDIIEKMISTMQSKVSKYSNEIKNSKYTFHQLLTLASIVESEGASSSDRKGVAGVFYNRLDNPASFPTLGSDVTTYYGVKKEFSDGDLYLSELKACNGYNTSMRSKCPIKGLPVGPISSPSMKSIEAVIEPTKHDYYFFVADKNGKTYFTKTDIEHNKIIAELKSKGLWYVYK